MVVLAGVRGAGDAIAAAATPQRAREVIDAAAGLFELALERLDLVAQGAHHGLMLGAERIGIRRG